MYSRVKVSMYLKLEMIIENEPYSTIRYDLYLI